MAASSASPSRTSTSSPAGWSPKACPRARSREPKAEGRRWPPATGQESRPCDPPAAAHAERGRRGHRDAIGLGAPQASPGLGGAAQVSGRTADLLGAPAEEVGAALAGSRVLLSGSRGFGPGVGVPSSRDRGEARVDRCRHATRRGDTPHWRLEDWQEYASRRSQNLQDRSAGAVRYLQPLRECPEWDGTPLAGRLMLQFESGFGDHFMLARWIPAVRDRVGTLVVRVDPALKGFFIGQFPDLDVSGWDEDAGAISCWTWALRLPHLVGSRDRRTWPAGPTSGRRGVRSPSLGISGSASGGRGTLGTP
jgi:hypothetical protein